MVGKRLVNTGGAGGAAAFDALANFETVTYTGNGGTQKITGYIRKGAAFNGSSSYILTSGDYPIQGGQAHSVSFWVNFNSTSAQFLYGIGDTVTSFTHTSLRFDTSLTRAYLDNNGGAYIYSTSLSLSTGTWYYITHTYDGSGTSELFIDGTSVGTQSVTLNIDGALVIGRRPYYGSDYFNGKIDQFRVFDKELSSSEVTTLYGENNASSTKSTTDIFGDGSGIALYEFEEGAKDTGGVNGYIGAAGVFNGSNSYIRLPNNLVNSNSPQAFSVSVWINPSVSAAGKTILGAYGYTPGVNYGWTIYYNNGLIRFLSYSSNGNMDFSSNTSLSLNSWSHVVVTYDSTSCIIYVNGSNDGSASTPGDRTYTSSHPYVLGAGDDGGTIVGYITAKLDQVRIFNKAISLNEVTTLYGETSASATKSTADIFDDGSGLALYELEGNALDTGGANGKFGSAAIFNGSSSYIETPSLIPVNNYSFSCWVYFDSLAAASNYRVIYEAYKNTWWYLAIFDGGKIATYNGTSTFNTTSNLISAGQWYHIVYTSSSTSGKNIYLNGNSTPVATTANTTGNSNPSGSWEGFGKYHTTGVGSMHGKIDQVRIYNTTLSSSDVTNLYNESSVPTANLIAHYKLDGDATDEQGSYDGTATNVSWKYDGTETNVSYAYDGTATNVDFVGTSFQPDLVWIKNRANGVTNSWHTLTDSVRGGGKRIFPNVSDAESADNFDVLSFQSNGFTIGTGTYVSSNGGSYVAWTWKAGGAYVTDTSGDLDADISANVEAGFSIVRPAVQTGINQSIPHGLDAAPELIIQKTTAAAQDWIVYAPSIFPPSTRKYLYLNRTDAATDGGTSAGSGYTGYSPNSVTDTFIYTPGVAGVSNYDYWFGKPNIMYCFHSVEGYQKIGTFQGTGTTSGNIVTTGFRPRFLMWKSTSATGNWQIVDSIRSPLVDKRNYLYPNLTQGEDVTSYDIVDFNDDSFQLKQQYTNKSGYTYIYLAIA